MKSIPFRLTLTMCTLLSLTSHAADLKENSPEAGARTHAQNYKDMVLATCMAQAYRNDAGAAKDTGSSIGALRDWTYFDLEKSPDAIKSLVDRYLARDYSNPLVEPEIHEVRFDFLKCMDLYHSKALADLVERMVIHPKRTYRQGNHLRARAASSPDK
ncbi:type VI secretion system amidase immunity protein Tai4 [Pseudoduganella umbonata]|uniref:Type VI secretion system (T6SS) amidase immunity protein Tai4 n=1 Tax=Pseudoduganella umbonata TaxID=864828 RepID=A0A4P8HX11_9BURK|nr:type VI secretion system amidase immunity protein Tai4 [Pseudoduganella umbonata]MBB3223095.1 hypothetical protein [Pseudoduganella umbonata]QCP13190.1 hypothetical protein FCL38_24165 [Pseudoduganella umbonata]